MSNPYSFDPTGQLAANRINNEQQIITAPNHRNHHFVVPTFAPYFADNVTITYRDLSNNTRPLVEGIDYHHSFQFIGASRACAKPIYGGISFLNLQLTGVVTLSYNTVGGDWTIDAQQIEEILSDTLRNPRVTTWEQVVNVPVLFPPIDHEWNLQDLVGMKEVKDKVEEIALSIANKPPTNPLEGIDLYPNKNQIGLGNVDNFKTASDSEAVAGVLNSRFMTPRAVKLAIDQKLDYDLIHSRVLGVLDERTGSVLVKTVTGQNLDAAVTTVKTVQDLRELNTPLLDVNKTFLVNVLGYGAPGDGKGSLYFWDIASSETDNGFDVVKPLDNLSQNVGRWINIQKNAFMNEFFNININAQNLYLTLDPLVGTTPRIIVNRTTELIYKIDFNIDNRLIIPKTAFQVNDIINVIYQTKEVSNNFGNDSVYKKVTLTSVNIASPIVLSNTVLNPAYIKVKLNELLILIRNVDYVISGNVITVNYPIQVGDVITIERFDQQDMITMLINRGIIAG